MMNTELHDILPSYAAFKCANSIIANSVGPSKVGWLYPSLNCGPYFPNICQSQLRVAVLLALEGIKELSSTLFLGVIGIILMRSNPEMVGIHAKSIIASVANNHWVDWRESVSDEPRNSVRLPVCSTETKRSVSIFSLCRLPIPAGIRFLHLGPKTLQFCSGWFDRLTRIGQMTFSFFHKLILYVEVRAQTAANTVTALAYFSPISTEVKS